MAHSAIQACATSFNLHLSMRAFASCSEDSSHPVVLVEGRVVGEPNASLPVQLARNARTSVAAILTVFGNDGVPTEG